MKNIIEKLVVRSAERGEHLITACQVASFILGFVTQEEAETWISRADGGYASSQESWPVNETETARWCLLAFVQKAKRGLTVSLIAQNDRGRNHVPFAAPNEVHFEGLLKKEYEDAVWGLLPELITFLTSHFPLVEARCQAYLMDQAAIDLLTEEFIASSEAVNRARTQITALVSGIVSKPKEDELNRWILKDHVSNGSQVERTVELQSEDGAARWEVVGVWSPVTGSVLYPACFRISPENPDHSEQVYIVQTKPSQASIKAKDALFVRKYLSTLTALALRQFPDLPQTWQPMIDAGHEE